MIVKASVIISHPARQVWSIAGGFDFLPEINEGTCSSRLEDGGRVRVLVNQDGSILWERLLEFDEPNMTLAYEIFDAKGFVSAYGVGFRGKLTVRPAGENASFFDYEANFTPSDGVDETSAHAAIAGFAERCGVGIRRFIEARAPTSKQAAN